MIINKDEINESEPNFEKSALVPIKGQKEGLYRYSLLGLDLNKNHLGSLQARFTRQRASACAVDSDLANTCSVHCS